MQSSEVSHLELLFAVHETHQKLSTLLRESITTPITTTGPHANTQAYVFMDVGSVFLPLILSWLRETSLQSVHWLAESQQQPSPAAVDGYIICILKTISSPFFLSVSIFLRCCCILFHSRRRFFVFSCVSIALFVQRFSLHTYAFMTRLFP